MKLSVKGLAIACGIAWALGVLCVGVANLIWPTYGVEFLRLIGSVYPGYKAMHPGFAAVVVGALYALVDGAVCGAIVAWLYNCCACKGAGTPAPSTAAK